MSERLLKFWGVLYPCTALPLVADPVWLASVPLTVTVEPAVAYWGVIPVMEIASAGVTAAGAAAAAVAARAAGVARTRPGPARKTADSTARTRTTERTACMLLPFAGKGRARYPECPCQIPPPPSRRLP